VLRVGTVRKPVVGPREVLVRVAYSGVNPTDVYARSGSRGGSMLFPRVVPHHDGSGVIEAVGTGVSPGRVGQAVWLHLAQHDRPHGTAAELVALPEHLAVPLPPNVTMRAGACLGIPWLTAWMAVSCAGSVSGQRVLIAGGRGAVASYAIQLASAEGAEVITTDRRSRATTTMHRPATVVALDGPRTGLELRSALADTRIDRIIESNLSDNLDADVDVLRKGGTLIAYGTQLPNVTLPASRAIRAGITIRFIYVFDIAEEVRREAQQRLHDIATADALTHLPVKEFDLGQVADAHRHVEAGNHGVRAVLRIDGSLGP
jgi:NADPH2:quinone reductase